MKNTVKKVIALVMATVMVLCLCSSISAIASLEIIGDASIVRALPGKTSRVGYTLSPATDDVVWSVEGAPDGVTMMPDGGVLVNGNAGSGNFVVQAKNQEGVILAEKTVTIVSSVYQYTVDTYYGNTTRSHRLFVDFESQTVGNEPNYRNEGIDRRNDYPFSFGATASALAVTNPPLVRADSNGNKYISARGLLNYSSNQGSTFTIVPTVDSTAYTMEGSTCGTFEADFMAETDVVGGAGVNSLMYNGANNTFDFRYEILSDGTAAIYSYMNENGTGKASSGTQIATVESDKWFNVRIEADFVSKTYDMYVNNKLVINDKKHNAPSVGQFQIGAAIDNFSIYSGALQLPRLPESLPEKLYFTTSRDQSVITLDKSVYFGAYGYEDKVTYSGSGFEVSGDKMFVPESASPITVNVEDSMYDLEESYEIQVEQGIELSFDDGIDGMDSGSAVIDNGALDTTVGEASFDLLESSGDMLLTFNADRAFKISVETENDSFDFVSNSVSEMAEAVIKIDTANGHYIAVFDGIECDEGDFTPGYLESLTIEDAIIDNLIFSSMNITKPFALAPVVSGTNAVGQALTADYTYYSPWNAEEESADITWYIADEIDGQYTEISTGEKYVPEDVDANKYIKYTVAVNDGYTTGDIASASPVFINDVYSVSLSSNTLTTEVRDVLGTDSVYAVTMLYQGNALTKKLLKSIDFNGGNVIWQEDITGYDGAEVMLFYSDSFKAVSLKKKVGTVPNELLSETNGKNESYVLNGKLYLSGEKNDSISVLIYGHESSLEDETVAYSNVYEREDFVASSGTAQADVKLAYANVVRLDSTGNAVIRLPELEKGSYRTELISGKGEESEILFMQNPEEIIKVSSMDKSGFKNVLKLFLDMETSEIDSLHQLYLSLSADGKQYLVKLLSGENYDIKKFDLASYLIRYLENTEFNKAHHDWLIERMNGLSLNTQGISLLKSDANPSATGTVIMSGTWTTLNDFVDLINEKSVLYGVYHVKNYKEADTFLKVLTDTNYPDSNYKDNICDLVAGNLYSTLDELKQKINDYTPGGGGGGGGSSSGSSTGGNKNENKLDGTIIQPGNTDETGSAGGIKVTTYPDVPVEHWASEAIGYLTENGIVNGRTDGSFGVNDNVTRAEYVKILCEAFELNFEQGVDFIDVAADAWYSRYVKIAAGLGIAQGSDGYFRPNDSITREDAAVLLYRILAQKGEEFKEADDSFTDAGEISAYAKNAVSALQSVQLINGMSDGSFSPKKLMSRAQCAQIIANALRR